MQKLEGHNGTREVAKSMKKELPKSVKIKKREMEIKVKS